MDNTQTAEEGTSTEFVKNLLAPNGSSEQFTSMIDEIIGAEQKKLDAGLSPEEADMTKSRLKAATSAKFILEYLPTFYKSE